MLCLHKLAHLLEALLDSLEILLESIQVAFGGIEEVDDLCHFWEKEILDISYGLD